LKSRAARKGLTTQKLEVLWQFDRREHATPTKRLLADRLDGVREFDGGNQIAAFESGFFDLSDAKLKDYVSGSFGTVANSIIQKRSLGYREA
jgi:hypothetical protein